MFDIEGSNCTATVLADWEHISEDTVSQIHTLVSHPAIQNDFVVQADGHKASGAVVGFTMPLGTRISPVIVGFDIGCGMYSFSTSEDIDMDGDAREQRVRDAVPMGRETHSRREGPNLSQYPWQQANRLLQRFRKSYSEEFGRTINPTFEFERYNEDYVSRMCERVGLSEKKVTIGAGTLGSGNHFVELGRSERHDDYWITIHSGSRFVGKAIGKFYKDSAHELREGDVNRGIKELDWLEKGECDDYFVDMIFAQVYAIWNRYLMGEAIKDVLGISVDESVDAPHNYIDFRDLIVRKGATPAREGQKIIIPINMSDGILVCKGLGSDTHLDTAPHGAGRIISRREAKDKLSIENFERRMEGIYTKSVSDGLLSESPQAYKDAQYITEQVRQTAEITDRIKPIHNFKG